MSILVLSQRDIKHALAGGAELYTHKALQLLAREYEVIHFSMTSPGLPENETIDYITYIRKGNTLFQVFVQSFAYYIKHRRKIEIVIDHCNTHQFFTFLWARHKRLFFIHQLTQEIWIYFFGNFLGRLAWGVENFLLLLSRGKTITVSECSVKDLTAKGFKEVYLCPEGNVPKRTQLPYTIKQDYFVYTGRLMPYKRVEDAIRMSAELNKRLIIIGRGHPKYVEKLKRITLECGCNCEFSGYLPADEKDRIIEQAELLIMPSIREGWGLVITEAANLGTPSLVYNVSGTKEAVNYGEAGFVAHELGWEFLVVAYRSITPEIYYCIRRKAFEFSLTLSWDRTAQEFRDIIHSIIKKRQTGEVQS